jgi:hypothetical protein
MINPINSTITISIPSTPILIMVTTKKNRSNDNGDKVIKIAIHYDKDDNLHD